MSKRIEPFFSFFATLVRLNSYIHLDSMVTISKQIDFSDLQCFESTGTVVICNKSLVHHIKLYSFFKTLFFHGVVHFSRFFAWRDLEITFDEVSD